MPKPEIVIAKDATLQEAEKVRQLAFNYYGVEVSRTLEHSSDTNYFYTLTIPGRTRKMVAERVMAFSAGVRQTLRSF